DHRARPVADAGVQAPTGGDQQREAGARLLVAETDGALVIERHGNLSLSYVVCCIRARIDETRASLESLERHDSATAARPRLQSPAVLEASCLSLTRSCGARGGGKPTWALQEGTGDITSFSLFHCHVGSDHLIVH